MCGERINGLVDRLVLRVWRRGCEEDLFAEYVGSCHGSAVRTCLELSSTRIIGREGVGRERGTGTAGATKGTEGARHNVCGGALGRGCTEAEAGETIPSLTTSSAPAGRLRRLFVSISWPVPGWYPVGYRGGGGLRRGAAVSTDFAMRGARKLVIGGAVGARAGLTARTWRAARLHWRAEGRGWGCYGGGLMTTGAVVQALFRGVSGSQQQRSGRRTTGPASERERD